MCPTQYRRCAAYVDRILKGEKPADADRFRGHSTLRIHVRPARSIFSKVPNFCRSAIAALVRSP
jgi:hypothetical protein